MKLYYNNINGIYDKKFKISDSEEHSLNVTGNSEHTVNFMLQIEEWNIHDMKL